MTTLAEPRTVITQFNNITEVPDELHDETQHSTEDTIHMKIATKHDGDYSLSWNPKNSNMAAAAQIMYNEMVKEGMEPHLITKSTKKKEDGTGEDKTESRSKLTAFPTTLADGDTILFLPIEQKVGG